MTAKEKQCLGSWMEKEGYLSMWIRPELVNDAFKYYKKNPPGNRPEMMPMDNSLNQDIHEGVMKIFVFADSNHTVGARL